MNIVVGACRRKLQKYSSTGRALFGIGAAREAIDQRVRLGVELDRRRVVRARHREVREMRTADTILNI
jgi:hypothetical protein